MLVIATFVQTAFHPGFCFPRLSSRWTPGKYGIMASKTSRDVSMEDITTGHETA